MHDFIAIGDTVTDAFIRLKEASVHCDIDQEHCTITMAFGDKIPYESVEIIRAVGNSANAAVAASRLGLTSALISDLGDDQSGTECLKSLKKDGVDTGLIKIHQGKESNYHFVLWYESDRTILVKHQEYERLLPNFEKPKWLYLSSLGSDSLEFHSQISEYLKSNPDISLAFQPGTFQIKSGYEILKDIYKYSKIFFCNIEEAGKILGLETMEIGALLEGLHNLGPEIIVITDGPKGAYLYDGTGKWFMPPYPDPKPPFERTGAGDAFASTTVVALELGKEIKEALMWGAINSMSVVGQVGAQKGLLSKNQIEEYLAKAPIDFKPRSLD